MTSSAARQRAALFSWASLAANERWARTHRNAAELASKQTTFKMSTPLPDAMSGRSPRRGTALGPLSTWMREPLLHFVLLGGLLFTADHLLISRDDDPRTIVVGADVDAEARRLFNASRGRDPNLDELKALRQRWIDNEVLYREGLALRVDRGDTAIRERVIFKALSIVDANTQRPPFDDTLLRQWFESRRAKYDEPARYDFQEAVVSGDTSEAAVLAFVRTLNAGASGDIQAGLRVFRDRPHENLVLSYGADFAKALESGPIGEWRSLPTREGMRAIRLEAVTPPKPAEFEALRGVVLQDWTDATMADQRTASVRALAQKYTIKLEEGTSK